MGTRLTQHRGQEGVSTLSPWQSKPVPSISRCHNRGLGLPGTRVSLRLPSLTPLQENALGKRRLLRLEMKHVCEPGAEHGCSSLAPNNVKMPLPWGKSRWQLASEEGPCDVPSTCHLLPGKGISRPPTHCSAGTVRHLRLCQACQPAHPR